MKKNILVFVSLLLLGFIVSCSSNTGRYELFSKGDYMFQLDSQTGAVWLNSGTSWRNLGTPPKFGTVLGEIYKSVETP